MLERKKLGIDPSLTDKFFAPYRIASQPLPKPVMPLPPNNSNKLKEFLTSKEADEYKATTQIALVKLREILENRQCSKSLLDIIPRFEERHLGYEGGDKDINYANLKLYQEGIPTLITIINIIEQEANHPEKWLIPICNLLQEVDHTCGPGTHTHIFACLKNIKASENLHAYLKNMQENLVRQHINAIIMQAPRNSLDKTDEIHIINYIQNIFAKNLGLEKIRDAYLSQACKPKYKLLLEKFIAQFTVAIKNIFDVDTILSKLIESNNQLLTLIESAFTASLSDYTTIIDNINQILDFYGPIDANNKLQLRDIFTFNPDEKIIKKHWQADIVLKFNIYERLRLNGYIDLSSLKKYNSTSLGTIHINNRGSLALSSATPTYQVIDSTSESEQRARITIQTTSAEIFRNDKLTNTCVTLSGCNPNSARKIMHPALRSSFERQAQENLREAKRKLHELKLPTQLLEQHDIQKLKTVFDLNDPRTSLLLLLVNLYFNNYQQFEIFHKQIQLSQHQKNEFDLYIQEELFHHPLIAPHLNPINNKLLSISPQQLIGILNSLPHDTARYTFLKNMEFNPTIEKLDIKNFLELLDAFSQLSFSLIHLYTINLSPQSKMLALDSICSHTKQKQVPINSIQNFNDILRAFPEIPPHYIMRLITIIPIDLLKKQLLNNSTTRDPILRLTSTTPNHLPLNYLMIALLTHYIAHSEAKINVTGSYSNSSFTNQSHLGQAKSDLILLMHDKPIPIAERLNEQKHSTPLFFSSMYLLYDYLLKQKPATQSDLIANSTFKTGSSSNIREVKKAADKIIYAFEQTIGNKMVYNVC